MLENVDLAIVDIDDTLIYTNYLYDHVRRKVAELIAEALGFADAQTEDVLRVMWSVDHHKKHAINPATGQRFHYGRDRFPGALQDTYRLLCESSACRADPAVLAEIDRVGRSVFDPKRYRYDIKPGAQEFMKKLYSAGAYILLLTKGDEGVQSEKIDALRNSGVSFHTAIIVESEKRQTFSSFSTCGFASRVSVGDDYNFDIAPALEFGYQCIWIAEFSEENEYRREELMIRARADGVCVIREFPELLE